MFLKYSFPLFMNKSIQEKINHVYKYEPDQDKWKKIKKEITDTPYLYEREWLLEKWEEINRRFLS